jgi:hypothetical protein
MLGPVQSACCLSQPKMHGAAWVLRADQARQAAQLFCPTCGVTPILRSAATWAWVS